MRLIVCGVPRTGTACMRGLLRIIGLDARHQQLPEPAEYIQCFEYDLEHPPPCMTTLAEVKAYSIRDADCSHSLVWLFKLIQDITPDVRVLLALRDPAIGCSSWAHMDKFGRVRKIHMAQMWYTRYYARAYEFALLQASWMKTPPLWYSSEKMFRGEYLDDLFRFVDKTRTTEKITKCRQFLSQPTNHRGDYEVHDGEWFDDCRRVAEQVKEELVELGHE